MLRDNVSLTLTEIKNYLKIEYDDDDDLLETLLDGACEAAENYMNRDFEDEIIPAGVEKWILKRIARDYEARVEGITRQKLGDEELDFGEDYSDLTQYKIFVGF